MDKNKERFILCKLIVTKMRRVTEINGMLDHYNQHGTIGYPKRMAELNIDDLNLKKLHYIKANYPTYKARKLAKANQEKDPDKKKVLMDEYNLLSSQLEEARTKIKSLG